MRHYTMEEIARMRSDLDALWLLEREEAGILSTHLAPTPEEREAMLRTYMQNETFPCEIRSRIADLRGKGKLVDRRV